MGGDKNKNKLSLASHHHANTDTGCPKKKRTM